jgi:hypothetical protein
MYLLDVESQCLEEFNGENILEYAILSYTWEKAGEILFEDLKGYPGGDVNWKEVK